MLQVVNLSFLESKKIFKRRGIYIGIFLCILFASAIGYQAMLTPKNFGITHVNAFFASIATIVLFIYSAKTLGDEFDFKTSTQIFTSKVSRVKMIFAKLLSILTIGVILALANTVVSSIFKVALNQSLTLNVLINDLWVNLYIYLIYSFVVGSFTLIISSICLTSISGIIGSIGAFMLGPSVISLISSKAPSLDWITNRIPFYAADRMISSRVYGTYEVISLIVSGIIFITISCIIISKKDLRWWIKENKLWIKLMNPKISQEKF